jgi:hypothetical protein
MDIQKRTKARVARAGLSVEEHWLVAIIGAGFVVTAIWILILGWATTEIFTLVF